MSSSVTRILGATLPDTHVIWRIDTAYLDATGYTWSIEAAAVGSNVALWTKTTGITAQVGTATTPSLVVAWDPADLGALTAGSYRLEFTGTLGTDKIKGSVTIAILDQIT